MLDDAVFFEDVDAGDGRRTRQRVARVGEPAGVGPVLEAVGHASAEHHATEGEVAGVDPFGEAHQVGFHIPLVEGEPLAAAAEARHHFVADHHDPVAVAEPADALEVPVGWHEDAVGAHDRLDDDRRHRVGPLDHEHFFEVLQGAVALLGLAGAVEGTAVGVRAPELHHAGHARLTRPAARIAGEGDRPVGGPVVAAVVAEHLEPTGVQAGHSHRVLGGLGAAIGEEHHVEVTVFVLAASNLDDQAGGLAAGVVGVDGGDGAQAVGLFLDRRHQLGVLVADVDVDQLAGEIEVAGAVVGPEVAALGARDHGGVERALGAPRMEHVGTVVRIGIGGMGVEDAHGCDASCHISWRTEWSLYPHKVVVGRVDQRIREMISSRGFARPPGAEVSELFWDICQFRVDNVRSSN